MMGKVETLTGADQLLDRSVMAIGGTQITLGTIIAAVVILVLAIFASWVVHLVVGRAQKRVGDAHIPLIYIGGQIARYIIVFAGISIAISTLGVDLSALSLFAGALGVGIGLGLQDIVKNFVCGIILLFDRSIEVGDYIELEDGSAGAVVSIGPRATTLVTTDNVDVMVPNANLLNGKLTNWTRNRATRRVHVPFSVAYGSDKEKVREAAIEAARSVPFSMPDDGSHKTQVWLTKFGDSSLDFELVVWPTLDAVKRPGSMMAAYCWALDDALRKYGIEIPFPQRDVRVRSFFGAEGEEAMRAFNNGNGSVVVDRPDAQTSEPSAAPNDAAEDIVREG
ncbi:MAG: mechanosensitive ion channel [Sphingobium sp.]|nr:mechanosensitive ion channel [Sphingobium sp.]MCP5397885.1 mechanosensitive ion channel [Sphingomonas sp.]